MRLHSTSFEALAMATIMLAIGACASSTGNQEFETAAEIDMQQIVCRSVKPTGSRLSKRVCKTQGEWTAEAQESKELMRNRGRGATSPPDHPTIGN